VATRRNFTQEYKDQAVSLVIDSGRNIAKCEKARSPRDDVSKWVTESQVHPAGYRQGLVRARAGRAGTAPEGKRHSEDGE